MQTPSEAEDDGQSDPGTPTGLPSDPPSTSSAPTDSGFMPPPSPPVSAVSASAASTAPCFQQLQKRIDSLQQENRVLRCELDTYKLRVKSLQEENRAIRQASVHIVRESLILITINEFIKRIILSHN